MRIEMRWRALVLAGVGLGVWLPTAGFSAPAEMPAGSLERLLALYVPMQEALAGDSAASVGARAVKVATEAETILKAPGAKPTLDAIEDLEAVVLAAKGMTAQEIDGLR